ncbi:alpha-amylase family glycosyl hydrolase [Bifidobacterium sp. UTBIF-78]|uniref:alpha-amylase family glycosyl hydrolase n=1 Tax=Bifidobacterium sp. UTBIF-78 TaxID=1465263 RepID=UPI001128D921|nr:alpha-amylase family glycosyl hydrolase [Bifidobacterium sp. UTBIF-78]TPF91659.1 alpha-amylase [Bifidobacterium sp. UTBIF-78]
MTDHTRHAQTNGSEPPRESPVRHSREPRRDKHHNIRQTARRRFPRPAWLAYARFYEVYPQSFADTNGDGIGDLPGVLDRLDYIRELGCNALWLNPCFDSPFRDAGYDVRDYTRVAPRYGTNDDLVALFEAAHERGMHVLLDLVPGHTSEEHAWFRASAQPDPADRTVLPDGPHPESPDSPIDVSERYIWTDSWIAGGDGLPFIGGETERDGTYILNFFKCQPALNYGFAHPSQPWQKPALGPDALATCEAMLDVMRFWLSRGADGFRVDMADSLVKHDDEGKPFTIRTWQYLFSKIRPEFPEAAFVSEWGRPHESMEAGFDMDFYLDWRWGGHPNGYNLLLRNTDTPLLHEGDASYFNADSGASIAPFLEQYLPQLREAERADGLFDLITCNHDTLRTASRLSERERKVAYGMLLTMPGCPFLYYGDEIGMRYRPLPTKEGGYTRTGSRTPMQWDSGMANLGFSTAPAGQLYLPVDPDADAPTVADELARQDSLLNWVHTLLTLRTGRAALTADAGFAVVAAPEDGRTFAYLRTAATVAPVWPAQGIAAEAAIDAPADAPAVMLIAMNPGRETEYVELPDGIGTSPSIALALGGPAVEDGRLRLPPQSFAIVE